MHASAFDRYQPGHSLVHQLDPRVKVVVTVLFIVSNVLLPDGSWVGFVLAFGLVLLCSKASGLGLGFAVTRSLIALPFALAAVTVVFTLPGAPLHTIPIGPWTLIPTDAGLIRFASIVVRSLISVQMAILLTTTTSFHDLVHALRHLRLPRLLVGTIAFMYRSLFVLADEALRLKRARDARSARLEGVQSGRSALWRGRVAGNMAGQLFVRSIDRADRVYNAMLARGYSGHLLTLNPHRIQAGDLIIGTLVVLYLVVVQLVSRSVWP